MPVTLTIDQTAAVLGTSRKRVVNLASEGILHRSGDRITAASLRVYMSRREDDQSGYRASRAAYMSEKARVAKIERQKLESKLVGVDEIISAWGSIMSTVRTRLLSIPSRLAAQTAAATTPRETFALLTDALHEALLELSNSPPEPRRS
jgi:phage terminase Nu1 subunit (DNA packaging protein)